MSLEGSTNSSLLVLLPSEDLFIKEKWHQKWKEERMTEKEGTSLELNEPVFATLLACLSITLDSQRKILLVWI